MDLATEEPRRSGLLSRLAGLFDYSATTLIVLVTVVVVAFLLPVPAFFERKQWEGLVVFVATILGVILRPYPLPVVVLFFLTLGGVTRVFSEDEMLSGFSNGIVWIVFSSFLFARTYAKTGLGKRIALILITKFGRTALGLGYSLTITDLLLAPLTASNTARAGGIVFPIAKSLAVELGSYPTPQSSNLGGYLLFTAFQANVITSSMFLTAIAVNPLTVQLAKSSLGVEIGWGAWFLGASVPGTLCLLVVPWVIHRWYPVVTRDTEYALTYAKAELQKQGPVTKEEKLTLVVFVSVAAIWATSSVHGIAAETIALLAVSGLAMMRILSLTDIVGETEGWSTFIWFGGMLSLANVVSKSGIAQKLAHPLRTHFADFNSLCVLVGLCVVYFYLHYLFVSITAQVLTLYTVFLSVAVAVGSPRLLAALCFCYISSLYASTTYYSSGPAPIFYGSGYIDRCTWLRVGLLVSFVTLLIWLTAGVSWWHVLGYW